MKLMDKPRVPQSLLLQSFRQQAVSEGRMIEELDEINHPPYFVTYPFLRMHVKHFLWFLQEYDANTDNLSERSKEYINHIIYEIKASVHTFLQRYQRMINLLFIKDMLDKYKEQIKEKVQPDQMSLNLQMAADSIPSLSQAELQQPFRVPQIPRQHLEKNLIICAIAEKKMVSIFDANHNLPQYVTKQYLQELI